MESPIKTPEQLLKYRSLEQILAGKGGAVYAVNPADSVLAAVRQMSLHNVGFLVVLDRATLAGVLSERDCARKALQEGRAPKDVRVGDIMVRDVFTVTLEQTLPHCMALMHERGVRHLPVLDQGRVAGVVSMRDLLGEVVAHHERVIRDLEIERMQILGGGTTY